MRRILRYPAHFLLYRAMASTTVEQSHFSTWFKLLLGIGSVLVGMILMKTVFARMGAFFLDPFFSFLVLVAISIGVYYLVHWVFLMRVKRSQVQD